MATTNINIRVDENLKRKAEAIYSELGLNLSTAMNIFLRYSVRYGGIPFDLRLETPNTETLAAIDDVNHQRGLSKSFDSVEALMEDLNA
ncbi:MAG: type II toxin-antitoxin system RelB/DinJ family antitoxin [Bacillota bacterium]